MSWATTNTTTYTVADIRKVVDCFAADFSMMAQSTGLRSRDSVAKTVQDLKVFAESRMLLRVTLFLFDRNGNKVRAAEYRVADSAVGWQSDRPGNSLWPYTPDGSLYVLATLANEWWSMTDAERHKFIATWGLNSSWKMTDKDTSLTGLSSSAGQRYASNGYGWERTNYSN